MQTFEKIRELRESHNWTQEEVANKIALSVNGYAKIERGETRLTLERLEQFAEIFDVDITYLMKSDNSVFYQIKDTKNSTNNQGTIYNSVNNEELEQYQAENRELKLIIQHKDEIIEKLNEQIADLRTLNQVLQNSK